MLTEKSGETIETSIYNNNERNWEHKKLMTAQSIQIKHILFITYVL